MKTRAVIKFNPQNLLRKVDAANTRALYRAGSYVRTVAVNSIKRKPGPKVDPETQELEEPERLPNGEWTKVQPTSKPGKPPFTHAPNHKFKKRIFFQVDKYKDWVYVGVPKSADPAFRVHELGGTNRRRKYPPRPFMRPALIKSMPRLPRLWRNILN